jgi:AcrR family transcriptional regulator
VTAAASNPSDAPVRQAGTRTRSGNTMAHTRAALLEATAGCIARYGVRKTTMVDVASRSGVAKATLYNHFRTKEDVLVALVEQQISDLVAIALAAPDLETALTQVADAIAESAPLTRVAADEPAALAPLLSGAGQSRGWQLARDGVAAVLAAARVPAEPAQVELVLRWFTSQLMWPSDAGASAGVSELVAGLRGGAVPMTAVTAVPPPDAVPQQADPAPAALGWPG